MDMSLSKLREIGKLRMLQSMGSQRLIDCTTTSTMFKPDFNVFLKNNNKIYIYVNLPYVWV